MGDSCLVLDLDGVVNVAERFSKRYARDFRVPKECIDAFFEREFPDCLLGRTDLKEKLAANIGLLRWDGSVDELIDYWFIGDTHFDQRVLEVVRTVRSKGVKCFVATNNERYRAEYFVFGCGLGVQFDGFFSSAQVGAVKPDELFFGKLFGSIREIVPVGISDVVFWDDAAENVNGARNFGFRAYRYTEFHDFEREVGNIYKLT